MIYQLAENYAIYYGTQVLGFLLGRVIEYLTDRSQPRASSKTIVIEETLLSSRSLSTLKLNDTIGRSFFKASSDVQDLENLNCSALRITEQIFQDEEAEPVSPIDILMNVSDVMVQIFQSLSFEGRLNMRLVHQMIAHFMDSNRKQLRIQTTPIYTLNDDILICFLNFLRLKELVKMRLVCKRIRSLIDMNPKQLRIEIEIGDVNSKTTTNFLNQHINKCPYLITSFDCNKILPDATLDLSTLTNLTSLSLGGIYKRATVLWPKNTENLTSLSCEHIGWDVTLDFSTFVGLTSLSIGDIYKRATVLWSKNTKNLTSLSCGAIQPSATLDLSTLTNLTSLSLDCIYQGATIHWPQNIKNLISLSCKTVHLTLDFSKFVGLRSLSLDYTFNDAIVILPEELTHLQLRKFDVKSITTDCVPSDTSFKLENLSKLESLTIETLHGNIEINLKELPNLKDININKKSVSFDRFRNEEITLRGYRL